MTFPEGVSAAVQPSNLHDATWGILSAVYGGAIHPTAEGHAAMADAALEGARRALHLPPPDAPITAAAAAAAAAVRGGIVPLTAPTRRHRPRTAGYDRLKEGAVS